MKIASLLFFLFQSAFVFQGLSQNLSKPTFPADSVKQELAELFTELAKKHPGFYRYNEKQEFDTYLDSIISSIHAPLPELDLYRLLKPVFAKIGCLHTGISLSEKTEKILNNSPNCLPLDLYYKDKKAYVKRVYLPKSPVVPGDQILTINGRDISDIYTEILSYIPMDGYNETGKYKLLSYSFSTWYRNMMEVESTFTLEILHKGTPKTHELSGVKAEVFPTYTDIIHEPMLISFQGETAIVRIPSFANSYYEDKEQDFQKELKGFFQQIHQKNIPNLILDLRSNTGGSDSNAAHLASYFFKESFRYWDRIEVTEDIAKEVKGASKLFYGKPKQEHGRWLWHGSGISSYEFSFYKAQKPVKHPFTGKVFALIDGACMSSCADLAAILQHNEKALFIGEETGGAYQGNTSGIIPEETLSSGLIISIPLLKYFNAVNPEKNIGRGTMPDFPISANLEEYLAGKDPVLAKALELIKNE